MAIDWAPALVKEVGSKPLNGALSTSGGCIRFGTIPPFLGYDRSRDGWRDATGAYSMADSAPINHSSSFRFTDVGSWVAPISRFGTRVIISTLRRQLIPYADLIAADWELPHPDMMIWIWQAARHDPSPCLATIPMWNLHRLMIPAARFVRLGGILRNIRRSAKNTPSSGANSDYPGIPNIARCRGNWMR